MVQLEHFSIWYKMKLMLVLTVNLRKSRFKCTPDSNATCSCQQASTHQRHLSEAVWISMRRASLLAQEKSGYCACSPCELMTETSLGSSSRTGKTTDSARLLISPACLFICQGEKKAQCHSDIQSVSYQQCSEALKVCWGLLCGSCRGTSRRSGALS